LLAISQQTLVSRENSLKLMDLKLHNGAASELEAQTAQTLLQNARVTMAVQQRQRLQDENALFLLLGQSLPETARTALTFAAIETILIVLSTHRVTPMPGSS
jgi:multidrug efflux system outer membrane protein